MKSYKKVMPILLIFAFLCSVVYYVNNLVTQETEYETALMAARDYAEKEVVDDSIEEYKTAISLKPSLDLYLEAGETYLDADRLNDAEKWYEDEILEAYPKEAETYLFGIHVFLAQEDYVGAFEAYDDYQGHELYLDEVEDEIDSIRYMYFLSGDFQDVRPFSNVNGVAAVEYEDRWGYVNQDGGRVIRYGYLQADCFNEYASVIDEEGDAIFIDADGNEKINENFILENDPDFGHVEMFRSIQSGLILAYNGEIWNYYDAESFEKKFGGWKDACPITNGVGAVSKDGEKWALISSDGKEITDYIYDKVLADDKDIICRGDAVIVCQDGSYFLVNSKGKRISEKEYNDAYAFYDSTMAAVKRDGNWLFVDMSGTEYNLGEYGDARSFSNGFAAVKIGTNWGYITSTGEQAIEVVFSMAGPFDVSGVAFVQGDNERWSLLSLYQYNH